MATKKRKKATFQLPGPAWYDPALDANVERSNTSLQDLLGDTGTQLGRLTDQWGIDQDDARRARESTEQSYGRNLEDLLRQRTQTQEDYTTSLADLQRNYERLGSAQTQQARSAGVAKGGALAQALGKRTENQAHDKAPIDTSYNRAVQASQTTEKRLGEDRTGALGDIDRALAAKQYQYTADTGDLGTQLSRASRDNTLFGINSDVAKIRSAQSLGWSPPGKGGGGVSGGTTQSQKAAFAANQRKQKAAAAAAIKAARRR